jgi:23S rRNA (pseudouridine1915-N3)-methyltransferase
MKVTLLVVGKTNESYFIDAVNEYVKRLKHYLPFETETIPDVKNAKNLSIDQLKEKEGDEILKYIDSGDFVILLDEHGKEFTSVKFADYLEKKMMTGEKRILFIIGGAYGFSQKVYDKASDKLAMSKMTFSHQMIRLIFTEQLYRAMTILKGQPYHHE